MHWSVNFMYCLYSSLWLVSAFVTSSTWSYFRPLLSRLSLTTWRELCWRLVVDTDLFCTSWSQLSSALFKILKKGDYLHFQKMKVQTSIIFFEYDYSQIHCWYLNPFISPIKAKASGELYLLQCVRYTCGQLYTI